MASEATMRPVKGWHCAWMMVDRRGYAYPHDIQATHRVSGTNIECMDGIYCRRHALAALERAREEEAPDD